MCFFCVKIGKVCERHTTTCRPSGNGHRKIKKTEDRKFSRKPLSLPAMENFIQINFVNYEKYLNKGLWLVDFWAEWCSACTAQDKIYEELHYLFQEKLNIGKINVSDNRLLADRFGVRNIPFLLLMKDGKVITQMPGIQSKEYLIHQIKQQIQ